MLPKNNQAALNQDQDGSITSTKTRGPVDCTAIKEPFIYTLKALKRKRHLRLPS